MTLSFFFFFNIIVLFMSPGAWDPGRDAGMSNVTISQGGMLEMCENTIVSDRHLGRTKDTFLEKGVDLVPAL